jgi:hypothetical protein
MREKGSSEFVCRQLGVGEGNDVTHLTRISLPSRRAAARTELLSVGLIDPKPLTRQSILETLAKALTEYVTIAVSKID